MKTQGKWIAGEMPVRPAARSVLRKPSGEVVERLMRAHRKNLVGRPLAVALRSRIGRGRWRTGALLVGGIALSLAGIPVFLAGFWLSFMPLVVVGGIILFMAVLMLSQCRFRPAAAVDLGRALQRDAAAFDADLDKISPSLPPPALTSLVRIKETLASVLSALAQGDGRETDMPAEDLFFAREMLTRYIPDACRHYVEATGFGGHQAPRGNSREADESLVRQLDVLHVRLEKVLARIAAERAEKLARHEAFLQAKK